MKHWRRRRQKSALNVQKIKTSSWQRWISSNLLNQPHSIRKCIFYYLLRCFSHLSMLNHFLKLLSFTRPICHQAILSICFSNAPYLSYTNKSGTFTAYRALSRKKKQNKIQQQIADPPKSFTMMMMRGVQFQMKLSMNLIKSRKRSFFFSVSLM